MKIGISSYSLFKSVKEQGMSIEDAIQWIADSGAEHFEMVAFMADVLEDDAVVESICRKAKETGLRVSAYCTAADFLKNDETEVRKEIETVKTHIDIANRMGAKVVRSDLSAWGRTREENVIENFDRDLPKLISYCQELADYAAQYDITLTVENHGTYVNGGDRVRRLILGVNRKNYKCTLDVGNAICVDEDPMVCIEALLPFATMIHFKDFYIRENPLEFGNGNWQATNNGRWFRGSIVGHGDLPVYKIMQRVKEYGYDGDVSIEFEGMEDSLVGAKISMENVKRLASL